MGFKNGLMKETEIIFSVDYEENGHILLVKDKSWIETELIISPNLDDNGFGLPKDFQVGIYKATAVFTEGKGWLNGDVYDSESYDLKDIEKIEINELK